MVFTAEAMAVVAVSLLYLLFIMLVGVYSKYHIQIDCSEKGFNALNIAQQRAWGHSYATSERCPYILNPPPLSAFRLKIHATSHTLLSGFPSQCRRNLSTAPGGIGNGSTLNRQRAATGYTTVKRPEFNSIETVLSDVHA